MFSSPIITRLVHGTHRRQLVELMASVTTDHRLDLQGHKELNWTPTFKLASNIKADMILIMLHNHTGGGLKIHLRRKTSLFYVRPYGQTRDPFFLVIIIYSQHVDKVPTQTLKPIILGAQWWCCCTTNCADHHPVPSPITHCQKVSSTHLCFFFFF